MIDLGDYVVDTISGFRGVITATTRYLNGNIKHCVETCELDNGKPITEAWFDQCRLELSDRPKERTVGLNRHS